ncbi:MAG TPA: ATP-binding protein, partial [Thermoanaerobaculia bacterium]|nr:ATP-binding protein [Thermoanaerobaculia bacterium]
MAEEPKEHTTPGEPETSAKPQGAVEAQEPGGAAPDKPASSADAATPGKHRESKGTGHWLSICHLVIVLGLGVKPRPSSGEKLEVPKKTDEPPGRFSDKKYLLPFGRYVGSTEVEPPADEVLVGREGQRAYLIDLLISTGRRGAYLVTGHRGAGKTSFVKYCVSEYEASVFSRFLRGNVGRGIWDRVFVLLFWASILVGALLATELVQLFSNSTAGKWDDYLTWVLLLPVGIILLYPCVYAKVVLETCIRASYQLKPDNSKDEANVHESERDAVYRAGSRAFFIVLFLTLGIWLWWPAGRPAIGIALLIPPVCALYATVQAISFRRKNESREVWRHWVFAVIPLGALGQDIWLYSSLMADDRQARFIFQGNLALGIVFLGLGSIFRGVDQRKRIKIIHCVETDKVWYEPTPSLKYAMTSGAEWYLFFGFGALIVGSILLMIGGETWRRVATQSFFPLILICAFSFFLMTKRSQGTRVGRDGNEETYFFQPRPMLI